MFVFLVLNFQEIFRLWGFLLGYFTSVVIILPIARLAKNPKLRFYGQKGENTKVEKKQEEMDER